jgi:hypothetical protein
LVRRKRGRMFHGSSSSGGGRRIPFAYGTEPERNAGLSSSTASLRRGGTRKPLCKRACRTYAMDNEAQLSTAVVTAPHDTFLRRSAAARAFSRAEIGVPGKAVVPPVFSPPALGVAVFDDEGRCRASTDEEGGFQELMGCGRLLPMWMSLGPMDVRCRAAFPVGTWVLHARCAALTNSGGQASREQTHAMFGPASSLTLGKINPNSWIDGDLRSGWSSLGCVIIGRLIEKCPQFIEAGRYGARDPGIERRTV